MFEGRRILAIVPARGGSKGLPDKNILPLHGKPLIAWTIEAALDCPYIDELIVSTDSERIAEISKQYGARVPFVRPPELATDTASSVDVVLHAITWFSQKNIEFDLFVLLQPTSPLRTSSDIVDGLRLLHEKQAGSVVSVCECDHHPFWSNELAPDGNMEHFLRPEAINVPRQQLPRYYRLNGALFVVDVAWFFRQRSFLGPLSYALIMDRERSVDIDTRLDFTLAEILLRERIPGSGTFHRKRIGTGSSVAR